MDGLDGPVELPGQELRGVEDVVIERGRLVAVVTRIERRKDARSRATSPLSG